MIIRILILILAVVAASALASTLPRGPNAGAGPGSNAFAKAEASPWMYDTGRRHANALDYFDVRLDPSLRRLRLAKILIL